jgi:vancomycin resistance protein YoaR
VDAALFTLEEKKGVHRAVTDGVAQGGLRYDASSLADRLYRALLDGAQFLDVALISTSGRIRNATSQDLGDLALIGEGHSDFRGSGGGRIANIHKGLTEHVHNAVVRPGETFSFNKLLDPPVTLSKGWHEALVIFDGDRLEMAPGGGICQVSTTFFRGLLAAGLPVLVRKSHSLFVTYYEKYGVGIDATVFPGQQDLVFVNDTPHHLLIQAEVTGYGAYVRIYGTPDGRNVELRGPYFAQNAPEGFLVPDRPIRGNEIAWVQNVRYSDGSTRDYIVLSRYKAIPKRVVQEYAGSDQIALER